MKHILTCAILSMTASICIGCGGGKTPGTIVEDAFSKMLNGDYKEFLEYTYTPEILYDFKIQILQQSMNPADEASINELPKKIKIVDEEVKDTLAFVDVVITTENDDTKRRKIELTKAGDTWKIMNDDQLQPVVQLKDTIR